MSRFRSAIALSGAAASLVIGCKLDPETPQLVYSLNDEAIAENADLADDPAAKAQMEGALTMLFGTPAAPAFLMREAWSDDEFDPNYWTLDEAGDEFSERLVADNRVFFAEQLAALEADEPRPGDVEPRRYAADLWIRWQEHLDLLFEEDGLDGDMEAVVDEVDGEEITWIEQAIYMFEHYYPTPAASAEMYRQQCFHCHGASGGGDGSTAPYLNPHPRDYRAGKFKFTALKDKARPRHEDLMRTLREGIYTTAMPSFARFPSAILSGLADYVRLLSIRGETEILTEGDYDPDVGFSLDSLMENFELTVGRWRGTASKLIVFDGDVPASTQERIEHGRYLFMSETGANCVKCHGAQGRGDGLSAWEPGQTGVEYVKDEWGNQIKPRDLTRGIYRFGRRPIDLYRRIFAGINGTPMPAQIGLRITDSAGSTRPLNENDIWDLVFYVRAIPALADRNDRPERTAKVDHDAVGGDDSQDRAHAEQKGS